MQEQEVLYQFINGKSVRALVRKYKKLKQKATAQQIETWIRAQMKALMEYKASR